MHDKIVVKTWMKKYLQTTFKYNTISVHRNSYFITWKLWNTLSYKSRSNLSKKLHVLGHRFHRCGSELISAILVSRESENFLQIKPSSFISCHEIVCNRSFVMIFWLWSRVWVVWLVWEVPWTAICRIINHRLHRN